MPFEMLEPSPEKQPEMMPLPNPPKLGVIQTTEEALMSHYRVSTIWVAIMERDPAEAREKLLETVKTITGEVPKDFEVPCIVKEETGKNTRERTQIRRAQRKQAELYAGLVDRLVRYRPESRPFAYETWTDDQERWQALWKPYECSTKAGNGEKKKKALSKLKNIEAE